MTKKLVLVIEPTDRMETVNGVQCRVWEGESNRGAPVKAWIPLIAVKNEVDQAAFQEALQQVKIEVHAVPIDMRVII